jgi:dimethylargininase
VKPGPAPDDGRKAANIVRVAVTREVSPGLGACELTHLAWVAIDAGLARAQHEEYEAALAALGCTVVRLAPAPDLPDAVFVEDTAVVLPEIAVVARPGAESRRPETVSAATALAGYRPLRFIEPPGTLDGGDVLRVGRAIYVGLSGRSNAAGINQLGAFAEPLGYAVKAVPVRGCLHLKSAVTQAAPGSLLINPSWVDKTLFANVEFIEVDSDEPRAANALLVGAAVVYPTSFPRTRERLEGRGIAVTPVDVSELQKAEGAVTCCSLVFNLTSSTSPSTF